MQFTHHFQVHELRTSSCRSREHAAKAHTVCRSLHRGQGLPARTVDNTAVTSATIQAGPSCSLENNSGALPKEDYGKFVQFFRQASSYIEGHRGRTFVVVIPGEVSGLNVPASTSEHGTPDHRHCLTVCTGHPGTWAARVPHGRYSPFAW